MAAVKLPRLPASPVEHSLAARAFVLAGFAVACVGVVIYGLDVIVPVIGLGVAAAGHVVSYRGRSRKRTLRGQLFIASLVFAAMAYFLADSVGAIFGGQMPQANFAIILVAVTSFDLKTRRNCYSSLWISLAILYLAAVYAWDYLFAILAAAWIICLFGFWAASHLRRMPASLRLPRTPTVIALCGALALGATAFVFVPQPQGLPNGPLVVSLPSFTQFQGQIENPALPLAQVVGGTNTVDLRYRGRLGDAPVMYVRTGAPAYWRGLVFDTYDNGVWKAGQGAVAVFPPYVPPRLLPPGPDRNLGTFVQTFRLLRDMPPVVDAAYPIESLYVPVGQLARDAYGTFRTPDVLRAGTTYSVVSYIPDLSPAELQKDPMPQMDPGSIEWPLGLDGLSSPAQALAARVTAGQTTEYGDVMALVSYLQHTYRYSLQVGKARPGVDPIDQFLFVDKFGYCEQFASAATLMLRSLGIPARLVTGYATGDYDPVLNQAIVREKDAHAWVEAWFPGDGWVPIDPTPTFSALPATQFPNRWAASGLARLVPHLTISAPPVVLASLGSLGAIPLGVAIAFVIVIAIAWLRTWRRRRRAAAKSPTGSDELLRLYDRLQIRAGRRRAPPETPAEYRDAVAADALLSDVTQAVNEGAYAGRWPDQESLSRFRERVRVRG